MILFWIFTFFFTVYVAFRLFGRQIVRFLLKQILKKVAKDTQNKAEAFHRNYGRNPYEEHVYVNDGIEISKPKHNPNNNVDIDEIVEDIEFEDVPSSKAS